MMISQIPTITASVTFLPANACGSQTMPLDSNLYRPHLVVGDANQRMPLLAEDGRTFVENYLGVCFTGNGTAFLPMESRDVTLQLSYYPSVAYDQLESGATFTIREGANIVGFGVVKSRSQT